MKSPLSKNMFTNMSITSPNTGYPATGERVVSIWSALAPRPNSLPRFRAILALRIHFGNNDTVFVRRELRISARRCTKYSLKFQMLFVK